MARNRLTIDYPYVTPDSNFFRLLFANNLMCFVSSQVKKLDLQAHLGHKTPQQNQKEYWPHQTRDLDWTSS